MAIDIYSNQKLKKLTSEQVGLMNDQWWFQPTNTDGSLALPSDKWHFEYKWVQWETDGTTSSDVELKKKQNFVLSQLPTKIKDSDEEKVAIREFVALMDKEWLDKFAIADIYQWFEIDENNIFGKNIRNLIWTTWSRDDMWEIWRSITKWVNNQALNTIYLNAWQKSKLLNGEDHVSESFTKVANNQVNKVLDFMDEKGLKDGVWVAEWTFEKFIWSKFRWSEGQKVLTEILNITAALSTKMSGTAKTEAELKFISDLLPDIWDSPDNFFIKLNNLKDFPLSQFNAQMTQFGLPELNDNTLIDKSARVSVFEQWDIFNRWTNTKTEIPKSTAKNVIQDHLNKIMPTTTWTVEDDYLNSVLNPNP